MPTFDVKSADVVENKGYPTKYCYRNGNGLVSFNIKYNKQKLQEQRAYAWKRYITQTDAHAPRGCVYTIHTNKYIEHLLS